MATPRPERFAGEGSWFVHLLRLFELFGLRFSGFGKKLQLHLLVVSRAVTTTCSTNQIKSRRKATVAFIGGKW